MAALSTLYVLSDILRSTCGHLASYDLHNQFLPHSSINGTEFDNDNAILQLIDDYQKKFKEVKDDTDARFYKRSCRRHRNKRRRKRDNRPHNRNPLKHKPTGEKEIESQVVNTKGNKHIKSENGTYKNGNINEKNDAEFPDYEDVVGTGDELINFIEETIYVFMKMYEDSYVNDPITLTKPDPGNGSREALTKVILNNYPVKALKQLHDLLGDIVNNKTDVKQVQLTELALLVDTDNKEQSENVELLSYNPDYDKYKYRTGGKNKK